MTYFCAMAPHHIPAGEIGLPVIETVEAKRIAADWMSPRDGALVAFATCGHLDRDLLAPAISQVRAALAEHRGPQQQAYGLRLLLLHLQGLCESRGIAHVDDESYWCWCQPYVSPARISHSA